MNVLFKLVPILLLTSLFFSPSVVLAKPQVLTADHLPGFIDKATEQVGMWFKFNQQAKMDYSEYLLQKRMAELEYISATKQYDFIETSASRYQTYLEKLSLYPVKNSEHKDQLRDDLQYNLDRITNFQSNFAHDSGWWLALQHDINETQSLLNQLQ